MRAWPLLLLLAGAGCSVDTARLDEPLDLHGWIPPSPEPTHKRNPEPGPVAAPGSIPVDLSTVLRLAGSNAVEIDLARSRALEAAHRAEAEQTRFLPFLMPRLQFFRHEGRDQETAGGFLDVDKQRTTAGGAVSVVLQPGEAVFRSLAARRRAGAAAAGLRVAADATLMRAAELYFSLVRNDARVEIAAEDLRAAEELLRLETVRMEGGRGLPASVARARARLAEARGALQAAHNAVATDSARLVEVLRLQPGTLLSPRVADATAMIELVDASENVQAQLARALAARPELEAASLDREAAAADAERTGWGWLIPELHAGAAFDAFGPNFGNLDDREEYFVALQWRLDLGVPARHAAAVQRLRQAELRRGAVRDRLGAAVVRSRAAVASARARVDAAREEVEAAEETLQLVNARHAEGAALMVQVLDAQAALTRARTALVAAVADHNTAQYALLRALGGPR